jgi:hypothetical protein
VYGIDDAGVYGGGEGLAGVGRLDDVGVDVGIGGDTEFFKKW